MSGVWDADCPDCGTKKIPGKQGTFIDPCSMTYKEHAHWRELRQEAARKAREIVLKAREDALLPEAIIKAVYDEAERQARRDTDRGHGG